MTRHASTAHIANSTLERAFSESLDALRRVNMKKTIVMRVAMDLASEVEFEALLPLVLEKATHVMESERTSLFLLDKETGELWTLVGEGLEVGEIRIDLDHGIAGHVARTGRLLNVPDAHECEYFDTSWDEKTGFRTMSVLCMPLINRQTEILGVIQTLNKKSQDGQIIPFDESDEELLQALCAAVAVAVENAELYKRIEQLFERFVVASVKAIEERDPITSGHTQRVTQFTLNIAHAIHRQSEGPFAKVQYSRAGMRELRYAGLLHDFGKVGVPEAILQKSERLPQGRMRELTERKRRIHAEELLACATDEACNMTDAEHHAARLEKALAFVEDVNQTGFLPEKKESELRRIHEELAFIDDEEYKYLSVKKGNFTPEERAIMESHVVKTRHFLETIPWPDNLKNIADIACAHHECMDGSGYPDGLEDERIPLGGKIMAVADIYDALTATDRPYKPAVPHDRSVEILRGLVSAGKLNGDILDIFIDNELYLLPEDFTEAK